MTRRPNVLCAGSCGRLIWRGTGCLPPGQAKCRECRSETSTRVRAALCAYCNAPFQAVRHKQRPSGWTETCSRTCGRLRRLRIDGIPPGGDPEKHRARWRAKNHMRRRLCQAPFDAVTPEYELALRIKAKRCPLCSVVMTDAPYLPASKELDHIVPRNVGGTHTIGNVRILCRMCNVKRPYDGSDFAGQTTLWAQIDLR